ncbi:hypothetical protein V6N13_076606 [Hibiscus sabdariffa]
MASTPATEGQGGVPLVEQTRPMEKVLHQEQHQLPEQSPQAVFYQLDDGLNEAGSELPSLPSSQEESFQADNIGHATGIHSNASRELSHDEYAEQDGLEPSPDVASTSAPVAVNTHPMITKRKNGIVKPKVYAA